MSRKIGFGDESFIASLAVERIQPIVGIHVNFQVAYSFRNVSTPFGNDILNPSMICHIFYTGKSFALCVI